MTNNKVSTANLEEYISRINKVIDYIENHLDEELSLDTLAKVACFSSFHFHRIFSAFVGETLSRFIRRLRLEKAANKLINNPKQSITDIAFDCGFSSLEVFARAFREQFEMSAGEWRAGGYLQESKKCKTVSNKHQTISKPEQELFVTSYYIDSTTNNTVWRITMKSELEAKVEVKILPEMQLAYVRHIGPYQGDGELFKGLFEKLLKWAGPRGLLRFPETQMLCVYHDDPNVTDNQKLRTSVCITVPEKTDVEGEVGKMTLPGGNYAVGHFEIDSSQFEQAWGAIYAGWLPESGYQPDDRPAFELCLNNPEEHPEHKHIVDICVPVKPL
jgi:AraC family transcriptional regulator